jgi:uncharacterized membrane protein (GlpM family)
MMQLVFRFLVGGVIVSLFAVLGDVLKPRSFAGLFGAAPSVALATLGLTILNEGKLTATQEARSMIGGAIALGVYAAFCSRLMLKRKLNALPASVFALIVWLICAIGAWAFVLRW